MSQLDALLAAVGAAPALPGARCRGKHHLFDEQGTHEAPETTEQRHAQALGLCRLCPALASCQTWFDTLTATRRPKGVVAGQLNTPKPPGRPTGTTKGKSA
ncbi:hypothetical protein [Mycolicibacterium lutetiense]|uniref:WhiB family redox-sensing transcriptional regulator n=1 Tax=Mycolicibacterium lutetiense TaxID=1641992 RepID=A0ABS4ZMS3_9MYCO|nr:hypothetical protein [Mycolicibacterium lutetiense]MBP2450506.1 WhiB family redox-sensing transcriptional regulator [Mycolicibacterium lutetiense]